ncbi:PKD-like family lipoprotein [Pedobacter insulae]|uniref:PKD-like family protein n=1 Tax=Pedobacter insulae TaxID=414048 RepID=A0A1I2XG28_9SPHI|nr:PKD-like family lipoprotein [Pedobacter insulae]SFH12372.1 PKD-like family protein [Pedobacter insulae]
MEKIKNIGWLLVLVVALTTSCKKDLSTLDVNPIAGVSLDKDGATTLSVTQFDRLVVNPKIDFNGADENKFKFQWKVTLSNNDTTSSVLSNTKNLDAEISMVPSATNQFYTLVFTATDKDNGLKYITSWPLTVFSSIGEGLVVATTADGLSTDLNHIMSPLVTSNYNNESVKFNVYSGANNKAITGLVKQMRFTIALRASPRAVVNTLFAITDNSLTRINTVDFSLAGQNGDLFYTPKASYNFQALSGKNQADVFIESGGLTIANHGITDKIAIPFDISGNISNVFAINRISNNSGISFSFYDETKGKFMYIPAISTLSFQDRNVYTHPDQNTAVFNPGNLPNKVNVAAGVGQGEELVHILKDKTTGKFNLYVFDKGSSSSSPAVAPVPKSNFELSNAPGIAQATNFVILDNQRVIYYTSGNKIYAILYGGASPIFEERYTVATGESITTLQIYQQSDYPWGSTFLPSNNNQLVMSTYGGTAGTGKVYILPMINLGVGNINQSAIKIFTGFNKVTAITSNK